MRNTNAFSILCPRVQILTITWWLEILPFRRDPWLMTLSEIYIPNQEHHPPFHVNVRPSLPPRTNERFNEQKDRCACAL